MAEKKRPVTLDVVAARRTGGKARAEKLSARRKKEIARKAA